MPYPPRCRSVLLAACIPLAAPLAAQCPLQLQPSTATNAAVHSLRTLANGDVIATGAFTSIGGVAANHVARWNGTAWSAFGVGTDGPVYAAVELANGDVVVGGQFTLAGGTAALSIARWDGSVWSPLGAGIGGPPSLFGVVNAVAQLANGDVVAGGLFSVAGGQPIANLARWNGSSWSPFGVLATTQPLVPFVSSLLTLPNGDLIAGGVFSVIDGGYAYGVARWNGSWSGMGNGWGPGIAGGGGVGCLLELANGDVLAGGSYSTFGSVGPWVQRWNGSAWLTVAGGGAGLRGVAGANDPSAWVRTMALLPNGDVVAAGSSLALVAGGPARSLVRWNGTTWSAVAGVGSFDTDVFAVDVGATGTVRAGGSFASVGGVGAAYLAAFDSTCPATVVGNGAGCSGSAGLNDLASTSLPWLGTSWTTRATGMPANAFVFRALGFAPVAVPLAAILPQGGAGCTLLVSPDFVDVHLATAGVVTSSLAIPAAPALVGLVVRAQVTPLELDVLGNIVAYTASNALAATIGAL